MAATTSRVVAELPWDASSDLPYSGLNERRLLADAMSPIGEEAL